MDVDIQIKRVKLEDSELEALVKSKWSEGTIDFEIFVRSKNCNVL